MQQAIGGVEGEIRVCLQYLFQGWGNRGPDRYKDMLLNTGTEEIGHIEMLATAVALNLEGAPASLQEEIAGKTARSRRSSAARTGNLSWDLGFLAFGALLVAVGTTMIKAGRDSSAQPGDC